MSKLCYGALDGAARHEPGEHRRVARCGVLKGEGACVGVDGEGEERCFGGCHVGVGGAEAFCDECRDGANRFDDEVEAVRVGDVALPAHVVVEDDDVFRLGGPVCGGAQAVFAASVDYAYPAQAGWVDGAGVGDAVELAVERKEALEAWSLAAGDDDDCVWPSQFGKAHGSSERVKIGGAVGDDYVKVADWRGWRRGRRP